MPSDELTEHEWNAMIAAIGVPPHPRGDHAAARLWGEREAIWDAAVAYARKEGRETAERLQVANARLLAKVRDLEGSLRNLCQQKERQLSAREEAFLLIDARRQSEHEGRCSYEAENMRLRERVEDLERGVGMWAASLASSAEGTLEVNDLEEGYRSCAEFMMEAADALRALYASAPVSQEQETPLSAKEVGAEAIRRLLRMLRGEEPRMPAIIHAERVLVRLDREIMAAAALQRRDGRAG